MELVEATEEAYSATLHALRPPGPAMAESDPLLQGLSIEWTRLHNKALHMIKEANPQTTQDWLPFWEQGLGLPDTECCGANDLFTRRQAVIAKILGGKTPTEANIIELAARFGFVITIEKVTPFTVLSGVGDPLYDEYARSLFIVHAPLNSIRYFDVTSGVNEPLSTWGNDILECVINHAKQAHTLAIFSYS